MSLFNRECKHNWVINLRSNVLQQDDMGYPLRLCICKCLKCGACMTTCKFNAIIKK